MSDIAVRRWLFLFLVVLSTAGAVFKLYQVLRVDGIDALETLFLILFAILFGWVTISFWLAVFGAFARLTGARLLPLAQSDQPITPRTAILMPVYNEDVNRIFSGVRAIFDSLQGAPEFDFFILSDSTEPANWVAEEVAWQRLRQGLEPDARIFYRHRHRNVGRKSGNIQDFCENWGAAYDYMVVLDADSVMSGETLTALVRLMDANPRTALIQAPATLVGRATLFARIQQFASSAYGPTYNAGLTWLQGSQGNYWGHNAIIRVRAFQSSGGLPTLPGKAPFGGEIMSHDFVEAALLLRAGWQVWMAPDLGGSYEEPPPTIYDHLKRDRRWMQGNLQHARILLAQGLKMPSRLHMATGIMSYLASPLWLLLLIVSGLEMFLPSGIAPFTYLGRQPELPLLVPQAVPLLQLTTATLVLLYAPKLLATVVLLTQPETVKEHGGFGGVVRSVLLESLFATLVAPVAMLAHSWFLLNIVVGRATGWTTQARSDRALPFWFVVRNFGVHTLIGTTVTYVLYRFAPDSLPWFLPLLIGLILAIPLVEITSSLRLGEVLMRARTFLVPSETTAIPVLKRAQQLLGARETEGASDYRHLVLNDPAVLALHLRLLKEAPPVLETPRAQLVALAEAARRRETDAFTRQDWVALLSDPESLEAARS
ncbi:MAG TPA: glucans biosynthesis glucosyltransferase MdoH [Rhizomicrobium sp.]|nr:glucans biosynthesis glucosyltransferase MdoH [Rhizomicrobium sp.]